MVHCSSKCVAWCIVVVIIWHGTLSNELTFGKLLPVAEGCVCVDRERVSGGDTYRSTTPPLMYVHVCVCVRA